MQLSAQNHGIEGGFMLCFCVAHITQAFFKPTWHGIVGWF
jgi:hypothetical protein